MLNPAQAGGLNIALLFMFLCCVVGLGVGGGVQLVGEHQRTVLLLYLPAWRIRYLPKVYFQLCFDLYRAILRRLKGLWHSELV